MGNENFKRVEIIYSIEMRERRNDFIKEIDYPIEIVL